MSEAYVLCYKGYLTDGTLEIFKYDDRMLATVHYEETHDDARVIIGAPFDITRRSPKWRVDLYNMLSDDDTPVRGHQDIPTNTEVFEQIERFMRR